METQSSSPPPTDPPVDERKNLLNHAMDAIKTHKAAIEHWANAVAEETKIESTAMLCSTGKNDQVRKADAALASVEATRMVGYAEANKVASGHLVALLLEALKK